MRIAALFLLAAAVAAQDRTITSDSEVRGIAFSKDGGTLFGISGDRKLRQWDPRSGTLRKATDWAQDEQPVGFLPASGLFAKLSRNVVTVSDPGTDAVTRRITIGERRGGRVIVASDGQAVAGSSRLPGNSRDETMRFWDVDGKERFNAPSGTGGTSAMAISPDGLVLAAGSYDTNIRIWSTRNGELLRLIEEIPVSMFSIAFTPDGRHLAAAGADRIVYFWDAKTWKLERKFTGQPEMISSMAFSADGRLLATGGFNDITLKHPVSVLVWDVASGKVLQKVPMPQRVNAVALAPDGKLLAATIGDKMVRLWALK